MGHTPFGYRIESGKAVIDNEATDQIRTLFNSYLSGDSLDTAAKKAGIKSFHAGIGRILQTARYLGDEYYPAIIEPDTYMAVQAERIKRAEKLGRIREPKEEKKVVFPSSFRMNEATQQYDDPFQQAEYAYSLIESEVQEDGCQ
ncbi:recombinase [Dehalococcoides sp. THU3]|uniref:recombinase n=1 Tax=Dehalococcoides sp. THU3 TaxID=3151601 RepID=UPI00321895BE